jgi:hypothetical protein
MENLPKGKDLLEQVYYIRGCFVKLDSGGGEKANHKEVQRFTETTELILKRKLEANTTEGFATEEKQA